MTSSILTLVLVIGFGGLVLTLIGVISALSIFRQHRAWRVDQSSEVTQRIPVVTETPITTVSEETRPAKPPAKTSTAKITYVPQPAHLQLPVREGTPDQIVIQIDAPEGPSRAQANVQRIIDYLKADPPQPNNQANAS